jgi:cyclopropane-fatty-acyl-phospholipid synthase
LPVADFRLMTPENANSQEKFMSTTAFVSQRQSTLIAPLLESVFRAYEGPAFAIQFWDCSIWYSNPSDTRFVLILRTEQAWRALSTSPDELSLAKKYIDGEIDVEGDLYLVVRSLAKIEHAIRTSMPTSAVSLHAYVSAWADQIATFVRQGVLHSHRRDAASIAHHYDKPAEFYELFLGDTMVYSCAYFRSLENSLDQAQRDKMHLICRKLDLRRDERFLDIGCGWGSLVLHASENFDVSAHGVSLSQKQVEYAKLRIAASKQSAQCDVSWSDYRDLDEVHMPFDKIASVGMCEHVGEKNIGAYFEQAYKLLYPGGLFLNHGITRSSSVNLRGPSFIDQYVFPDGELLTLSQMVKAAEDAGFEVRDVEDLREHYEETLHRWVDALNSCEYQAISLTDEQTFRTWKLYMTGSAEAFRRGDIAVHQMLLSRSKKGQSKSAKVREAWYRE